MRRRIPGLPTLFIVGGGLSIGCVLAGCNTIVGDPLGGASASAAACQPTSSIVETFDAKGDALPAGLEGKTIAYLVDWSSTTRRRGAVIGQEQRRIGSQVRIGRGGDIYYFQELGGDTAAEASFGTISGAAAPSGEVFRLNDKVDFLAEPGRADSKKAKLLSLGYYRGAAAFGNNLLKLALTFGGHRSGQCGQIDIRLEIEFSPDLRTCKISRSAMRTVAQGSNTEVVDEMTGESQCAVR